MKKNIVVAAGLVGFGVAIGVGLKLLVWILFVLAVCGAVGYMLSKGASLGEDDIEEVFPDTPARASDERHEWRNNSAKAPHAE